MHISQMLEQSRRKNKATFSFEFFPPKTAQVSAVFLHASEQALTVDRVCKTFTTAWIACIASGQHSSISPGAQEAACPT
jgi:5,10-methylenetetrahydrofolate reductase